MYVYVRERVRLCLYAYVCVHERVCARARMCVRASLVRIKCACAVRDPPARVAAHALVFHARNCRALRNMQARTRAHPCTVPERTSSLRYALRYAVMRCAARAHCALYGRDRALHLYARPACVRKAAAAAAAAAAGKRTGDLPRCLSQPSKDSDSNKTWTVNTVLSDSAFCAQAIVVT